VNASILAKLEADAHWSNPVAYTLVDVTELRRLLEERALLQRACASAMADGMGKLSVEAWELVRDATVRTLEP
jgi:hypothetical protein